MTYRTSRSQLGLALYRYLAALPYGAWGPVLTACSQCGGLTEREILEILRDYERDNQLPTLAELERLQREGRTPKQAVQAALNQVYDQERRD
jgi:hypothetical protein